MGLLRNRDRPFTIVTRVQRPATAGVCRSPLADGGGTDTIRSSDPAPLPPAMAPAPASPAGPTRLADQIERLSELMETLTYRMLELEERLVVQEERQATREAAESNPETVAALERGLEETAERLARIEAALAGADRDRSGVGRRASRLQVLEPAAAARPQDWPDPAPLEEAQDPDPFYDEGEQPFMDERIA